MRNLFRKASISFLIKTSINNSFGQSAYNVQNTLSLTYLACSIHLSVLISLLGRQSAETISEVPIHKNWFHEPDIWHPIILFRIWTNISFHNVKYVTHKNFFFNVLRFTIRNRRHIYGFQHLQHIKRSYYSVIVEFCLLEKVFSFFKVWYVILYRKKIVKFCEESILLLGGLLGSCNFLHICKAC